MEQVPVALIVDDDGNAVRQLAASMKRHNWIVHTETDGAEAIRRLETEPVGLVISELILPGIGGIEIIQWCKHHRGGLPVHIVTATASLEAAVNALKSGATDFLLKPLSNQHIAELCTKYREVAIDFTARTKVRDQPTATFYSRNEELSKLYRAVIDKIAQTDTTVLIQGESGTGKEVMASLIHHYSPRHHKPFIKVACAALPESLLESELFGHEAGAFTGAVKQRLGRFELANGGTLLLDEVGDLPLPVQVKLLRAIQERTIERVGGERTIKIDVRLITSTWHDLAEDVKAGKFREDLFYRLNVIKIHLPPLRDRIGDIEGLTKTILERLAKRFGKPAPALTPQTLVALQRHRWQGNIRELENVLERAMVFMSSDVLTPQDLGEPFHILAMDAPSETDIPSLKDARKHFEREFISRVLRKCDGNVSQAAELMKIARKNLYEKIEQLSIDLEELRIDSTSETPIITVSE